MRLLLMAQILNSLRTIRSDLYERKTILIFKQEPQSWKELQDYVKKIFVDCGYRAESPKVIKTARSEKLEVDVFVEIEGTPKQTIICECKNWDVNIPQAIVHSFRMQVNDSGANLGFLISKKGFQSSLTAMIPWRRNS